MSFKCSKHVDYIGVTKSFLDLKLLPKVLQLTFSPANLDSNKLTFRATN